MKINYTITGTVELDEKIYQEIWNDEKDGNVTSWDNLSVDKKKEFINKVESDNGYEFTIDAPTSEVTITSIEL